MNLWIFFINNSIALPKAIVPTWMCTLSPYLLSAKTNINTSSLNLVIWEICKLTSTYLKYGTSNPPVSSTVRNLSKEWICIPCCLQNYLVMVDICAPESVAVNTCIPSTSTSASLTIPIKHTEELGLWHGGPLCVLIPLTDFEEDCLLEGDWGLPVHTFSSLNSVHLGTLFSCVPILCN